MIYPTFDIILIAYIDIILYKKKLEYENDHHPYLSNPLTTPNILNCLHNLAIPHKADKSALGIRTCTRFYYCLNINAPDKLHARNETILRIRIFTSEAPKRY